MHSRECEPAFYSLLLQQTEEILPIVYTPTVGEACQRYHRLPLTPFGLHLRATDPCFLTKLQAWPHQNVRFGIRMLTAVLQPAYIACTTTLRICALLASVSWRSLLYRPHMDLMHVGWWW